MIKKHVYFYLSLFCKHKIIIHISIKVSNAFFQIPYSSWCRPVTFSTLTLACASDSNPLSTYKADYQANLTFSSTYGFQLLAQVFPYDSRLPQHAATVLFYGQRRRRVNSKLLKSNRCKKSDNDKTI
jgi:hypothetical protein